MKQQREHERAPCNKYKKRHRKDLTPDDIEAIVAASKIPHRLHKDIVQEFKIPIYLVSRLVKESIEDPRKLDVYRSKLRLDQEKK